MQGWKLVLFLCAGYFLVTCFTSTAWGQSDVNVLPFAEKLKKETIDPERHPGREAYAVGEKLAREAMRRYRAEKGSYPPRVAAVVWGKETAGREGPMVSFALALLGIRPQWDSAGKVVGLELISTGESGRPRIDVIMVATGLFRDLFKNQVILLDRAHRLSLAASYQSITSAYPELREALDAALAPLEKAGLFMKGDEPLDSNHVAGYWVVAVQKLVAAGHQQKEAGELAVARIFAPPAGELGSGVYVVGSGQDPEKVANQFVNRLSNVYSETDWGVSRPEIFKELLKGCNVLFHCSSESPILDQDDLPLEYTYVPGLGAALEKWGGEVEEITGTSRGEVKQFTGTPRTLQGVATGKEPGQQEDYRVRLGEKGDAAVVQEKPLTEVKEAVQTKVEGRGPAQTNSLELQASSVPLTPETPRAEPGPQIFEMELVPLSNAHSQEQTPCRPAVGILLILLAMGGVKEFLWHRREFGQIRPAGF